MEEGFLEQLNQGTQTLVSGFWKPGAMAASAAPTEAAFTTKML